MMTWYLWRAFYQSLPRHPLFWQPLMTTSKQLTTPQTAPNRRRSVLRLLLIGIAAFVTFQACCIFTPFLVIGLIFLAYLLPLSAALIVGGNVTVNVSIAIANEQRLNRYDVVAVTLPGRFGIGWALATRGLRTNRSILRLVRLTRFFHALCFLGLLMVGSSNLWLITKGELQALYFLVIGFLFVAVLYVDFTQALLLGAVVGILTPSYTQRGFDSTLAALALFLAVQLGIYIATAISSFLIISLFFERDPLIAAFMVMVSALVLTAVLHEVALQGLWRSIEVRLNLDLNTLQTLNRFGM